MVFIKITTRDLTVVEINDDVDNFWWVSNTEYNWQNMKKE